jgi:hypothetical protein
VKALDVSMKLISLLFFVSIMATTVQARVVATFNCKVISGTVLSVKEGRSQYYGEEEYWLGE